MTATTTNSLNKNCLTSKQRTKAVASAVIGNGLEFYDSTTYAFFVIYFAHHFFPSNDPLTAQIYAYLLFGSSYILRPFGGIILSIWTDKIGRKPVIVFLMIMMSLTTGFIGLLPSYETIGILAPIGLVILRLLQAIAVGGLFSTTTAFLMEVAPTNKRGFYAGLQMVAQAISPVLANIVALALLYTFGKDAVSDFWWRLPFVIGFFTMFFGLYMHKNVEESPEFVNNQNAAKKQSVLKSIFEKETFKQIIFCSAICTVATVSFFGVTIYMPGYAQAIAHLSEIQKTWLALGATFMAIFGVLFGGKLSDDKGRKFAGMIGMVVYGLAFALNMFTISPNSGFSEVLIGFMILGTCMGIMWGAIPIMMSESFPIAIRATAISIPYNFVVVIIGAMTPTYLKLLEKFFGVSEMNVLIYVGISIVVGLLGCYFWKEGVADEKRVAN